MHSTIVDLSEMFAKVSGMKIEGEGQRQGVHAHSGFLNREGTLAMVLE